MRPPNILLIMTDQQRWDTLGCYGNQVIETPNLNWIASGGTVFTRAYSCTPSCVPARASLLTGMDPWNAGILGMNNQPPMGVGFPHTLPGELQKRGYHTQGVGKMHFHPPRALNGFHHIVLGGSHRHRYGQDSQKSDYLRWFDEHKTGDYDMTGHGIDSNSWMARPFHAPEFLHPTNWTVSESVRFLERRDPTMPFFLKTSFHHPHSPYDPPQYYYDLYDRKQLPPPVVGEWAEMHNVPQDAADPNGWRGKRSEEEIHRARAAYYGLITHIDHQIGKLIQCLKDIGQWDQTLIVFTSDHGDMLGDHYLWRKNYAYEGSARIPLIVRLPKMWRESVAEEVHEPVCLQDIMPTLLDAAGAAIPETVDGRSMMPLIRQQSVPWRTFVHGEHTANHAEEREMQYVTDGTWKYIWFPRTNQEQLFHLASDPNECFNLSEKEENNIDLKYWRNILITVLEPRNAGLTEGDRLVCQAGRPVLISPKYRERMERFESRYQ